MRSRVKRNLLTRAASSEMAGVFRSDWRKKSQVNRWRPVGPDEFVAMDEDHPFVGEQSPRIMLDYSDARGIQQSGLTLRKGKKYVGRVILSGSTGVKVKVSLVWGEGHGDRQTIAIASVPKAYTSFPLTFIAQADTAEGRIEITGTGTQSFQD